MRFTTDVSVREPEAPQLVVITTVPTPRMMASSCRCLSVADDSPLRNKPGPFHEHTCSLWSEEGSQPEGPFSALPIEESPEWVTPPHFLESPFIQHSDEP